MSSYSFNGFTRLSSVQQGLAAARSNNHTEAIQWFEKALQENAADIQAKSLLGQALCQVGRQQEGLGHILQAGKSLLQQSNSSKDISKVLEIAAQLQQRGDFASALLLLTPAVAINNQDFRGMQMLAVTYAQLNKKAEALSAAKLAAALAPESLMMQVFLASLEADIGEFDSAAERLQAVVANPKAAARELYRANKELARVQDKLRRYDDVFPALDAAAQQAGQLPEFTRLSRNVIPDLLQSNRQGYDAELLSRWSGVSFADTRAAPVFVIGFMRSGTTLMQEVLDAHPGVLVADEANFIWAIQDELHKTDRSNGSTADKLRNLDRGGVERLRQSYWRRVEGRFGDALSGKVFVDKFTMNTLDIGLINTIFPDAKVLFVMRDPRDVCLSCYMQLLPPTPMTVHLQDWSSTIQIYAQTMDWWLHIKPMLTLRHAEYRYEDIVADFETTFRQIFAFLELDWDPGVSNFHLRAAEKIISTPSRTQVSQPLYSSSVARWRFYRKAFDGVMDRFRPYLQSFSYSE